MLTTDQGVGYAERGSQWYFLVGLAFLEKFVLRVLLTCLALLYNTYSRPVMYSQHHHVSNPVLHLILTPAFVLVHTCIHTYMDLVPFSFFFS